MDRARPGCARIKLEIENGIFLHVPFCPFVRWLVGKFRRRARTVSVLVGVPRAGARQGRRSHRLSIGRHSEAVGKEISSRLYTLPPLESLCASIRSFALDSTPDAPHPFRLAFVRTFVAVVNFVDRVFI